jgi:hypothetical protein
MSHPQFLDEVADALENHASAAHVGNDLGDLEDRGDEDVGDLVDEIHEAEPNHEVDPQEEKEVAAFGFNIKWIDDDLKQTFTVGVEVDPRSLESQRGNPRPVLDTVRITIVHADSEVTLAVPWNQSVWSSNARFDRLVRVHEAMESVHSKQAFASTIEEPDVRRSKRLKKGAQQVSIKDWQEYYTFVEVAAGPAPFRLLNSTLTQIIPILVCDGVRLADADDSVVWHSHAMEPKWRPLMLSRQRRFVFDMVLSDDIHAVTNQHPKKWAESRWYDYAREHAIDPTDTQKGWEIVV